MRIAPWVGTEGNICQANSKPKMQRFGAPFSVIKNPPTNVGDMGLIPGLGRPHMSQSS